MPTSTLGIWMNGLRVGTWSVVRGTHRLQYDPDWVESPAGRALSLSLPFTPGNATHRGDIVANFFDNLLPDSDAIRSRIRSRFGTTSTEAFDLLSAIGRDCVGAVQLLPKGEEPVGFDRIEAESLTDAGVEKAIATSLSGARALGQPEPDEFRISLAGAQEKTALLLHHGKWCRPLGATPTTHILKLSLGLVGHLQMDMQDSVENEWLCSRLMQAFGLDIASCEILQFGSRKVLAVERFDRVRQSAGWIVRLPQEDFCQALGLPSTKKYESDGGPGMRDILRVLEASEHARDDMRAFMKAQVVFWMLAAVDGHAKNFSLFHERGGAYRLTPFYDVLSAWPIIGRGKSKIPPQKVKMAMAVEGKNRRYLWDSIHARHWIETARRCGIADMEAIIADIVSRTPAVIDRVQAAIPKGFPAAIAESILDGVRASSGRLRTELSERTKTPACFR
jgi:serine/threonine-protein kinase HipA